MSGISVPSPLCTAGYDIWGVVAGVLGVLGLLPLLSALIHNQLPSSRFKMLHDTMSETESLFRTVMEEGLLKNPSYVQQTEGRLNQMRSEVEDLRAATHRATSFVKEIRGFLHGLSREISLLCEEVKELRASISATSSEERRRLTYQSRHVQQSIVNSDSRSIATSMTSNNGLSTESSGECGLQPESESDTRVSGCQCLCTSCHCSVSTPNSPRPAVSTQSTLASSVDLGDGSAMKVYSSESTTDERLSVRHGAGSPEAVRLDDLSFRSPTETYIRRIESGSSLDSNSSAPPALRRAFHVQSCRPVISRRHMRYRYSWTVGAYATVDRLLLAELLWTRHQLGKGNSISLSRMGSLVPETTDKNGSSPALYIDAPPSLDMVEDEWEDVVDDEYSAVVHAASCEYINR
ncbi:hypothetical protein A0H81_04133 [Grifola frondosa]|uniref:Uncharacterized protein n=1 Tax=Grifola frondosa TaxID=5627 RepID=A0A1C7MGC9_GRIFR|nr:hypothetical protein A0H81_04133 [Grifola frondosa]